MRTPVNRILFAYWNEVRAGRLAPKRFEIEPSRIAGILPDTFILEQQDNESVPFRLAGTRITETFAREFRGENIFNLFNDCDRLTIQRQISVIARQGAVGTFLLSIDPESSDQAQVEMTIMPLIHTRDKVDRFVGAISPLDGFDGSAQQPVCTARLIHHELIWPDGRAHSMIDAANRQTPFQSHIREARIVRYDRRQFRVYEGGLSARNRDGV